MLPSLTILHTEGSRRWGGQEARVLEECRWMHTQGHRAIIAGPANTPLASRAAAAGIAHHPIPFTRQGALSDFFRVRRLLRRVQPDVLNPHGNLDSKVSLCAAVGLGIPLVIRTRHSIPPIRHSLFNVLLYRHLSHLVFCTAECARLQLIQDLHLLPQKVFTVPTGIAPPDPLPDPGAARAAITTELHLPPGTPLLGYVGRLRENKGLDTLLESFPRVLRDHPELHLVLVGGGSYLESLQRLANQLQIQAVTHFVGHQDDPWPYYRAFACHVTPTPEFEGISQAARQAMFASCPVVATRVGGLAEIIRHEETGLLVDPGDGESLAAAIRRVLARPDEARDRVQAALAYVQAEHTLEHMGRRTLGIYRDHLTARPPRPAAPAR